jgi:N-acetylmuramic acid 6-phosphate (MurNAc-6-P) etherase
MHATGPTKPRPAALAACGNHVKTAIVMLQAGVDVAEATRRWPRPMAACSAR